MIESRTFRCSACGEEATTLGRTTTPVHCLFCGNHGMDMVKDSGPSVITTMIEVRKCDKCGKSPAHKDHNFCTCGGMIVSYQEKHTSMLRGAAK